MFDIGFSELLIVGIVALVVVGPERLPKMARTAGILFGRMQRYVANVKSDINRELEEFEQLKELKELRKEVETTGAEVESNIRRNMLEAESQVRSITEEVGTNFASMGRSTTEIEQASIASAASEHLADQVAVSAPQGDAASDSPQLELALEPGSHPTPGAHEAAPTRPN